jgi:preprotein translocase subunit SecG
MIYLAYFFALLLVIVGVLSVLVILMQRPSANAGMGGSLGGGAAEDVFGGGAADLLTKATYTLITLFFVISFGLYLGFLANSKNASVLSKGNAPLELKETPAAKPAANAAAPAAAPSQQPPAAATKPETEKTAPVPPIPPIPQAPK